uniref:Secreted protein n=1 Tax=Bursaphelenchus xylophilus TaxID=6326 RepID=A0A1I7SV93_BURXY
MPHFCGWFFSFLLVRSFATMPEAIFCYSGVKQAENWTEPFRPRECAEEFTWCIVSKNHNLTGNADVTL